MDGFSLTLFWGGGCSEVSVPGLLSSHRHSQAVFPTVSHRELHALVKSQHCLKGASHEHLQGGISFGIGAFNLVGAHLILSHRCFASLACARSSRLIRLVFIYRRSLSFLRGSSKFWNLPASRGTRCERFGAGRHRGLAATRRMCVSWTCLLLISGVRSVPPAWRRHGQEPALHAVRSAPPLLLHLPHLHLR